MLYKNRLFSYINWDNRKLKKNNINKQERMELD